ncbi:sulfate transmembrane transporter [Actinidia rufa]|uniref:Sulfate transmembrane transporter n=1 Tax=Actinidia rufa TaxID=165716 RepID=A0A7J0DYT5_9ERIC|nr:sulfate transmembrane transporter [Actinidia rufa]
MEEEHHPLQSRPEIERVMEEEHHPLQSRPEKEREREREREKGDDETVEAKPGPWRTRFPGGEILGVAEVFDGGEGEGEPLGEVNASDDGEGDDLVEDGHESGGAEEEEDGGGGDFCSGNLGCGEVGDFGDGSGDKGGGEVEVGN